MSRLLLTVLLLAPPWLAPAAGAVPPEAADFRAAADLEREAFSLLDSDPPRARERYQEAAERFARVAEARPGDGTAWWRAARCRWFAGEILPVDRKQERLEQFTAAEALAARGIEADEECAECMLWRFIALGRVATNRSLVYGMRSAGLMAELLERGIALQPTHRDGDDNSTLGNLHYGSAIFYRVLPDWAWLGWLIGVRGDKERALEHARTALSLHPARLDYRVELASQLLCLGVSEGQEKRLAEGVRMLERLRETEAGSVREERQITAAEIMLAEPVKACGYTGDAWVEIDAREALAAAEDD